MVITGMRHFENVCQKKLVEWYREKRPNTPIDLGDVFIVWSCKTLQNYKQELYEDVYGKITNARHTGE